MYTAYIMYTAYTSYTIYMALSVHLNATTVRWRGEFSNTPTPLNPACVNTNSRSAFTYSWIQGSVALKAAKAKGLDANLWNTGDRGFMSIKAKAPPSGRMRYASSTISLYAYICMTRLTSDGVSEYVNGSC